MVGQISAVTAYRKAIEANKNIQASVEAQLKLSKPRAILRQGDDLTVLSPQAVAAPVVKTFGAVLNNELIQNPVNKIGSASKTMFEVAKADGKELGPNLVELVEAVDTAQITINTMVKVRDLFISAYQEIMRMPI
ncbi:MAG: flagellar hook-basal body protein FliE [Candidatus Midichloriaceae bacterium]|jgi:flagellar hook-basal body complex protein FliE|nr:flagellar hook-basal body protein FliE [Candidatus Midichloriaceae bacterium]